MQPNEGQLQAINTTEGQIVIIACPGSGKTTTLLQRIHHMTEDLKIDPSSILMVTFSKAAADEMKSRYRRDYSMDSAVYFGTIHSFCLALIKKFCLERFGEGVVSDHDVTDLFIRKLKSFQNIGNKLEFINDLKLDISLIKNTHVTLEEYNPKCIKDRQIFLQLYHTYEKYKKSINRIDFDDMLLIAYDILCTDEQALSWVRNRYKYILVDEYQDVSEIQRDIIYQIAGKDGNLAVVGDDDQSIYGFRGASSSIMLNFQKDYPNSKVIYLSTNYRSNEEIVSRASSLIQHNNERFSKQFIANRGSGGSVRIAAYNKRPDEINILVKEIKKNIDSGIPLEEIAVIYRVNKQGSLVAKSLFDENIEFKTNDKITGIYDHWIYNDIWAFYRVANLKGSMYDFAQTLNHPNRYLHDDEIKRKGPDREYMIAVVKSREKLQWKEKNAIQEINSYFDTLVAINSAKTPGEAIEALIKKGHYRRYLSEYAEFRNEDEEDLNAVLDELLNDARQFRNWKDWDIAAKEERIKLEEATKGRTGVTLTTMHSAKGLEWKVVYIIDCVAGKCPYYRAKSTKELEEERRLFYVAMTRAKDNLVLMRSNYDRNKKLEPSIYIREAGIIEPKLEKKPVQKQTRKQVPQSGKTSKYIPKVPFANSRGIRRNVIPYINIGDIVKVIGYGEGTIKSIVRDNSGNPVKFTVRFPIDGDKEFKYPTAFQKGMSKKK